MEKNEIKKTKKDRFLLFAIIIVNLIGLLVCIRGFYLINQQVWFLDRQVYQKNYNHIMLRDNYPLYVFTKDLIVTVGIYKDLAKCFLIVAIIFILIYGILAYKNRKSKK